MPITDTIFKARTASTLSNKEGEYPSPFLDIGSAMLPSSLKETLDLCTMFWLKHGVYRSAAERIVRYFITDIEFNQAEEQRKDLTEYLNNVFNVTRNAAAVGDDLISCGMTASSMIFPFNRFLRCPQCQSERFIDNTSWSFENGSDFVSSCQCGYSGKMKVVDRKSFDKDRITMQRWSPYDISVRYHPYSGRTDVYWDLPADLRQKVKSGDQFIVRDMPLEFLSTIAEDKLFLFNQDFVHYAAEDTLASVNLQGYGMPRIMANFSQAFYVQTLKKANSSLAQDYTVPFRLISPSGQPTDNKGPWMASVDTELVNSAVSNMINNHRMNPTSWNFSPIPMNYQSIGGEGTMATPELLMQGIDEMLSGIGIAPELYRGSLSIQAAPMALRVLQQSWPELTSFLNGWLKFVVTNTTKYMNWETPTNIGFKKVTLADDLERRQLLLQLASSNMVSKRTAFGTWGIDPQAEQEQIINEMRAEQEAQADFQKETDEQMQVQGMLANQGMMPGGMAGDPSMAAGAAGGPVAGPALNIGPAGSVTERAQQVDQLAQQLVTMPHGPRMTELKNLRETDQELHALVKAKMEQVRGQAKSQATQQLAGGGPV